MSDTRQLETRSAELQQRWHGWGSPVGLGIAFVSLCGGIALLCLGGSLFT